MAEKNKNIFFKHLGLIEYQEAWDLQTQTMNTIVNQKLLNRDLPASEIKPTKNYLFFCQHPHVYTLGRSGQKENLLITTQQLKDKNATFFETNRGGDITYHGPGQIVGYPIFDLDNFFTDIHKYLRYLEEIVINTLREYGIESGRINGLTGVWVDYTHEQKARKICAFGVKASRWVTMHGFALNVQADLNYFNNIVPCGISDKAVTSMDKELGRNVEIKEVEVKLRSHFEKMFEGKICFEE